MENRARNSKTIRIRRSKDAIEDVRILIKPRLKQILKGKAK